MHPYVIDQLAKDRWEELQRIGSAAAAARRRRRQWWARVNAGRGPATTNVLSMGRRETGTVERVVDLRDRVEVPARCG